MGPERARQLGIDSIAVGTGLYGTTSVPLEVGRAKRFRLGDAELLNVPVTILGSLQGEQDFIIFGTNVIQQFLSTIEYPNERLVLWPRGDEDSRRLRSAAPGNPCIEVPFYLWGDHFMFARGGFGDRRDLNYFIDSGLVSLAPGTGGALRQACLATTAERYVAWGVDPATAAKDHFESSLTVSLGPFEQESQFFATVHGPTWTSFGGVRIDGLLSHAFLRQYEWTLDFETHRYVFSRPGGVAADGEG